MKIQRSIAISLLEWKNKKNRLPLILKGVRQVGKTSAVKDFGLTEFPRLFHIDLEKNQRAASIFRESKDPATILEKLQILTGQTISRQDLIFIDEIHACPPALTSLKYFAEDLPDLAIIAAGSLLGILLAGISPQESYSFPVGKVEFLDLSPITFQEFAAFRNVGESYNYLRAQISEAAFPVSEAIHQQLWDCWKEYLIVGGLPQVITDYASAREANILHGFQLARNKQYDLITAYEADIAKHSGKVNAQHIIRTLHAVPNKLTKHPEEGTKKFTFKDVIPGIRGYAGLVGPLDWLCSAGLTHRLPLVKEPLSPLKAFAEETLFKLFAFDVGILGALNGIDPAVLYEFNFGMYKGYIAESFVLQELLSKSSKRPLVSWHTKEAEVEFIIEDSQGPIPIEVKSSHKFRSRSLASYEKRFSPARSYILSANTGSSKNRRTELPLYMAGIL